MRMMKRLSPTALHTWERDREVFYLRYLSDNRPPRPPQTQPMAAGSAFDAYVKAALHMLYVDIKDPQYDLDALFEEQVEPHVRDWGRKAGEHLWQRYYDSGMYERLCSEVDKSIREPRFEFSLRDDIAGIPLHGKPDLEFFVKVPVIYDWKVNGYCGKSATSPKPLYSWCQDTWTAEEGKPTRGGAKAHPKFKAREHGGLTIGSHWLEDVDKKWADQTTIYGWMLGLEVGSEEFITGIDQLACKPGPDGLPLVRVAQHRCRISSFWQHSLLNRLQACWNAIQSGHIFSDMTREESDARCEVLDMQIHDDDEFWGLTSQKGFFG